MPDAAKLDTISQSWDAFWNRKQTSGLDTLLSQDYRPHSSVNTVMGPEGVKQFIAAFQQAFPDLVFSIDDLIDAGQKVVVRWSMEGTHQCELFGIPPSERRVVLTGVSIYRLQNNYVIESWDELDLFSLLVQIGAI